MSNDGQNSNDLSDGEALIVAEIVTESAATGLPFTVGLRAAADEAPTHRLASRLRKVADSIEAGQSLQSLLGAERSRQARYVSGLVRAAVAAGDGPAVMLDLLDQHQTRRDLWRSVMGTMAYPLVLVSLALALAVFVEVVVVEDMVKMYEEFELELPHITQMLVWSHRVGFWWLFGLLTLVVLGIGLLRLVGGPVVWRRVISTIPLVGSLWHWSGVSEWARLLAVLLKQRVELPLALRLAGDGVHDANVGALSFWLATEVENGRRLADAIQANYRLPATLVPLVRWGESSDQLDEAMYHTAEMYEGRVQLRSQLVKSIFPPIIFVGVAVYAVMLVVGLYAPMLMMIGGLM